MPGLKYDDASYFSRRRIDIALSGGVSVAGTAASDTELFRIPVGENLTIDKIRIVAMTGGTAAGPTITIGKSLGGTGTVAAFGTNAFGTNANNAAFSVTVGTGNTFVDGDHIVVTNKAGTAASTPKVNIELGWVETFVG